MRLRSKILLGYLAMAMLIGVVGLLGYRTLKATQHEFHLALERTHPVYDALQTLRLEVVRAGERAVGPAELADGPSPLDLARLETVLGDYVRLIEQYFPGERHLSEDIRARVEVLGSSLSELTNPPAAELQDSRLERAQRIRRQLSSLEAALGAALAGERREMDEYRQNVDANVDAWGLKLLALAVAVMGLVAAGGWWLSLRLTRPLARLRAASERLARGEFGTRVDAHGNDDLGALERAFDRMSQELAETVVSRDDLEAIVEAISEGLMVISRDGVIMRANTAMRLLCDPELEGPLAGRRAEDLLSCVAKGRKMLEGPFTREGFDCLLHAGSEHERRVAVTATPIRSRHGDSGHVLLVRDTSRQKAGAAVRQGRVMATPQLLSEHLATRLAVLEWRGRNVAVLMIGIDRSRELLQVLGQPTGEGIIEAVAMRFGQVLRPDDVVAAWNAEAVAVVLEDIGSADDLPSVAEALLEALEIPVTLGQHRVRLHVSIGMACAPRNGKRPEQLLACAESAMRCVMADGTRQYMLYAEVSGRGAGGRLRRQ